MKLPVTLLASLVVAGLVAGPVTADRVLYTPPANDDVAAPEDCDFPEIYVTFGRFQVRQRSAVEAVGTIRATLLSPDVLFADFTGTFDVQLALFGFDPLDNPVIVVGPTLSIDVDRGRWVARNRVPTTENQIDATTVTLRPLHSGDTASLTLKWQAQLSSELVDTDGDFVGDAEPEWGTTFLPFGVFVTGTLNDGNNACGTHSVLFQDVAMFP
jgi:hypothetical protein